MHITDWSITPGDNTSIDGLSIAPGAAARNVGGALRAIMAGVKAVADESGEAEQFFEDHPSYMVSGKGGYLLDIAPSAVGWGDYLTALAKDYASADRGALRIPYTATRMGHVLTFTSGTEVTVYIPSQRLIRTYTYSTGEWTDTGAEKLPETLGRLTSAESTIAAHTSELSDIKTSMAALGGSAVHKTGDETISGVKTFTQTIAGTAAAAEKLATARTITLSGAASGSVAFDGSADATLEVSIGVNQGAVIGEIRWFAMSTPPEGWLVCNGATAFTSNYAALFAAIGKTFTPRLISTDPDVKNPEYSDPTVFRLPNLVGKVPWGSSSQVGTEMKAGVPNINGAISTQMPGGVPPWINGGDGALFNNYARKDYNAYNTNTYSISRSNSDILRFDASHSNPIYGRSDTVQPPALCLLPCIRYE